MYKVNLIISYINNLIEAGIKVIEYGHTNAEFIEDCMKFSAFVLLTNYTSNAQEHIHKDTTKAHGVWVVKFLAKANTLKGVRHRVEALTSSTCNLLKIICKARLNRQVLIFMQFFKGNPLKIIKNSNPLLFLSSRPYQNCFCYFK